MTERERLVKAVEKAQWRAERDGWSGDYNRIYPMCKCELCRSLAALAAYDAAHKEEK